MKLPILILSSLLCFLAGHLIEQQSEEPDPYSIKFVEATLRTRSEGLIIAKTQTHMARMGDAVSIAILKILREENVRDPQTVEGFLQIIHEAFSQPQFIENETDKKPKVTLFFLLHIRDDVPDIHTKQDIDTTIQFVKNQTGRVDHP